MYHIWTKERSCNSTRPKKKKKKVFPRTVRRVQCLYLDGGWVVSAWSTVLREILRPYITAPRERRHRWINIWVEQGAVQDDRGVTAVISASGSPLWGKSGRNWALYSVHQSLIKCSLPWRFFWFTIETFFSKVMGKSNIFHLNQKWECA